MPFFEHKVDMSTLSFTSERTLKAFLRLLQERYKSSITSGNAIEFITYAHGIIELELKVNVKGINLIIESGLDSEISFIGELHRNFKPIEKEFMFYYPCWTSSNLQLKGKIRLGKYILMLCKQKEVDQSDGRKRILFGFKVNAYDQSEARERGYLELRKVLPIISTLTYLWMTTCEMSFASSEGLSHIGYIDDEVKPVLIDEYLPEEKFRGTQFIEEENDRFYEENRLIQLTELEASQVGPLREPYENDSFLDKYEQLLPVEKEKFEKACRGFQVYIELIVQYPTVAGGCLRGALETLLGQPKGKEVFGKKIYKRLSRPLHGDILPEWAIKQLDKSLGRFQDKSIDDSERYRVMLSDSAKIVKEEIIKFLNKTTKP